MEQLFAASYRLLPAAAVQYSFIKSKYFLTNVQMFCKDLTFADYYSLYTHYI